MGRGRDFREPRKRGFDNDFPPPDRGPSDYRPAPSFESRPPRAPAGPEVEAIVKWFRADKGFGFVEMSDGSGEAFLHIRPVEAAGHSALEPGTKLTIRVGQGQKGPQVTEVLAVDTSTAQPAAPRGGGFGGGGGGFGGGGGGAPGGGFRGPPRDRGFGGGGGGAGGGFDRGHDRPTEPGEELEGQVKWYNAEKGFGFIAVDGGGKDVFVHRSVLMRAGLEDLPEGQRVMMTVVQGRKGPEAQALQILR